MIPPSGGPRASHGAQHKAQAGGGAGRILPFRRSAVAPRRRRPSLWLALARPLAGSLALVGLPLALVAWLLTSPRFALSEVEVAAGGRVSRRWIEEALAPWRGANLLQLSLAAVQERLAEHPWAAAVEVEKQLPDRLRVEVTERRPAALLRQADALWYVDADGRRIAPVAPGEEPGDLLVVSHLEAGGGGAVGRALETAEELARANPRWGAGLTEMEVLGDEDFRLSTTALPFPLLVRAGAVETKVRRLEALLPEILRRYDKVAAIDLRFARRIVVQPDAGAPSSRGPGTAS